MNSDDRGATPRRRTQRQKRGTAQRGPVVTGWRESRMRPGVYADREYCSTCTAKKVDGRCPRCERWTPSPTP